MMWNIHKIFTDHIRPFFIFYFTEYLFYHVYTLSLPIHFICKMKITSSYNHPFYPSMPQDFTIFLTD